MSLREAHQTIDFSKLIKYGDIWTPMSLEAGDIMRADLPTYYKFANHGRGTLGLDAQQYYDSRQSGFVNFNQHAGLYDPDSEIQLMPRNTLVLGFDLDIETYDVVYVRLARFTYNVDSSSDPVTEPEFYREDIRHFSKPVVFRGKRIDYALFDTEAIGRLCDKTGTIRHAKAISRIKQALNASENQRFQRLPDLSGTLFVPALDPRKWKNGLQFDLAENKRADYEGVDFASLDSEAQNEIMEEALWFMAERVNTRRHQFFHERDSLYRAERRIRKKTQERIRHAAIRRLGLHTMDAGSRQKILGSVIDDIGHADKAMVDQFVELEEGSVPDVKLTSGKRASVQTLLQRAVEKYKDEAALKKRTYQAACKGALTEELREKFESVGVGGLRREPTIDIAGKLFRWRFLMMRIPDLQDPANYSDVTFRPCIVWNGYWSLNEQGDPQLAGLELYPCTRHPENFSWKMGIENPLKTKSDLATYLIPELMIRAPLSATYFHPNQPAVNGFFNLRYQDRTSFETKLEMYEQHVGEPKIWGLQERPDNWLPIEDEAFFTLPENEMRFASLYQRGKRNTRRAIA